VLGAGELGVETCNCSPACALHSSLRSPAAWPAANRTCHKHHRCLHPVAVWLSLIPSLVEPQVLIPAESWHSLLLDGEELYAEEEEGPQTAQMAAH